MNKLYLLFPKDEHSLLRRLSVPFMLEAWWFFLRSGPHDTMPMFIAVMCLSSLDGEESGCLFWATFASLVVMWGYFVANFFLPSDANGFWVHSIWFTLSATFMIFALILRRPKPLRLALG